MAWREAAQACARSTCEAPPWWKAACRSSMGGKIVGGVGVSGVTADQDGVVAKAAASALS